MIDLGLGVVLGVVFTIATVIMIMDRDALITGKEALELIQECERTIPRNQNCTIKAVEVKYE